MYKKSQAFSSFTRKAIQLYVFTLFLIIIYSLPAIAADLNPTYSESVQLAQEHAQSPAGWTTSSLFVIPDSSVGATEGLFYDGGALIVRTASKSRNFKWNYVGQAGYKIYGPATTDAAWVTTGNDVTQFLLANGVTGSNVTKLLERGLGMDTAGTHDAVIEFALVPTNDNLMRPTRNPDIAQYLPAAYGDALPFVQPAGMTNATYDNFKAYYENWRAGAYGQYPFPWTQLGYTFFWGNGYNLTNITGMSEFIILGQTPVDIYGIYATGSYIYTRNDGTSFSSAANTQFGNGFASFKIDGTCDTVWAGHRFQKNVRTATATPNEIRIESGSSISGGQGILVWSLNYDVNNNGTITGETAAKFGLGGTENIAVLFKGDTGTSYGTPVTTAGAVNRLTNSGTISSPGTAVKAEAGNTEIINNAGGIISGTNYAIQTGSGNDTVTVNGGRITGNIDLGTGTDTLNVTGAGIAGFSFTLNKDTSAAARVVNAETVTIADNTNLAVTMEGTNIIRSNDRFLIVDAGTLTVTPGNLTVENDSSLPMISFSAVKDGNKLYLAAVRDAAYYSANSGNSSLGNVLDNLANTASGDMTTVIAELDRSGNAANARKLEPIVNHGVVQASYASAHQFNQTVINRIEQAPALINTQLNIMNGLFAVDDSAKTGAWTQAFGTVMHQDGQGSTSGYNATVDGVAVGLDRLFYENVLIGFCFGYAYNKIKSVDLSTDTGIDSSQANIYGSFFADKYYLNTVLSFAYNRYKSSRHIYFGSIDRTAGSNYDGNQYSVYLEGGYNFQHKGIKITPLASLQYMQLHLNGYGESGADDLNLSVDNQRYKVMQSGLGAKIAYPLQKKEFLFVPELHARWMYDFIGDRQQTTSQFTGGGASFTTNGLEPPKSSYNVGVKLNIMTDYGITVSLNYDLEMKQDFHSHNGYINVRYEF